MFYAFLGAVAKNARQNNHQTGQAINSMAATLDSLSSHIQGLPGQGGNRIRQGCPDLGECSLPLVLWAMVPI